jgi:DNA-binding IclR family transcriptional regulator
MKLVERGHFVVGSIDIRQKAKGWLTELSQRTGQTTHLGIPTGVKGFISRRLKASWPPSPIRASAAACRFTPPPSARC